MVLPGLRSEYREEHVRPGLLPSPLSVMLPWLLIVLEQQDPSRD